MTDISEMSVDERLSAMQVEYQRTTGALSAASKQVSDYTAMMRQQEGYMAALRDLGGAVAEPEPPVAEGAEEE